jgi:hypothetical protein
MIAGRQRPRALRSLLMLCPTRILFLRIFDTSSWHCARHRLRRCGGAGGVAASEHLSERHRFGPRQVLGAHAAHSGAVVDYFLTDLHKLCDPDVCSSTAAALRRAALRRAAPALSKSTPPSLLTMEHRASASSLPGSDWSGHEARVYSGRAFFADADEFAVHGDHWRELRLRPAALRTVGACSRLCVAPCRA